MGTVSLPRYKFSFKESNLLLDSYPGKHRLLMSEME